MKPIAIFRHSPTEGPGYFASFLAQRGLPFTLVRVDQGESVAMQPASYSGLVFMGGPMSVNDDLPWIARELELIQQAVAKDIPVLGHCLGGQLIAKALGVKVAKNRVPEIGWGEVTVSAHPLAHEWFGSSRSFDSFHWHGETFSLPRGATHLLSSPYCENQAFCIGHTLAMQCHVEMTEELVKTWAKAGVNVTSKTSPSVQSQNDMLQNLPSKIAALNEVADTVYARWLTGIQY